MASFRLRVIPLRVVMQIKVHKLDQNKLVVVNSKSQNNTSDYIRSITVLNTKLLIYSVI